MMKRINLLFFACAMILCFAGCSLRQVDLPAEVPADAPVSQTASQSLTASPTQTPAPSTAPSATPAPSEPELVLHSGLCDDGSFSSGTLFLGDSLTYIFTGNYLPENGLLGDAKYAAQCGSQVTAFFSSTVLEPRSRMIAGYSEEFEGMKFYEAAASLGEKAEAIYFMWGTNFTPDATADNYIEIVDFLLENCPNATIHLQTIPHGDVSYTVVNQRIKDAYEHYLQNDEPRVLLIDTYAAIGNNTVDGIHLNLIGNSNWYNAIVEHAKIYNLSE